MRSRALSALMMDHAFAAPVWRAAVPRHVLYAVSEASRGTGSHDHRAAPVRASKARTTPAGALARLLSATVDPTITKPFTTAGGDVTEYSPLASPMFSTPRLR